jgi:hypothetical protein
MLTFEGSKNLNVSIEPLGNVPGVVYFGADHDVLSPIEVMVFESAQTTPVPTLRDAQKWRKNNQNRSVVVVAVANGRAQIYGPAEDRQPVTTELSTAQRILQSALNEANPIVARNDLVQFFDSFGSSEMPGIKNKGLFASHHIRENLPKRKDWAELTAKGNQIVSKRHRALVDALGFSIAGEERNTLILKATGPENRVIAVLLDDTENFDSPSGRFPSSPVAWGLAVAADNNVPWLIVLKKDQIRLHPGRDGVGVGQKGQAETFLELNLAQIDDEHLALLPLIFSAQALERDGEVHKILDESSKYAVILGARLRERVYESVVPSISIAVAKKLQEQGLELDSEGLQKAYSIALRILFRLLFQAYAEDRGLLPAGRNDGYDANSLKTIAKRDMDAQPDDFGNVTGLWYDLVQVWDAIDEGNPRWQVPAYNGGLFGRDPELHPEGVLIKGLDLPDSVMGPALQALLIDASEDGVRGPVDFRSLSVREFGTIYEGLLESSLSLAEVDLTVDAKEAWVPAQPGDSVMAKAGEPYFHSASGERKATGSYFTPRFVVDHLVERAIDPTIDKHLEKIKGYLDAGDQATANREFFDFRVADLAMGSAHFLVAAVDRIEAKMRAFLSNPENTVPGVIDEIARLRKAATEALRGDEIAIAEIEDPSLLRRQIARRCIYGIDINPMAVELARLAIWIHTFVPGLPMSTLNHNLVCGNSLTGIGSIDEALDALIPNRKNQPTFFDDAIISGLEKAKDLLIDAANASEADKAEVAAGAQLAGFAKEAALSSKLIFDTAVGARALIVNVNELFTADQIAQKALEPEVVSLVEQVRPAHMPYLFPEVFLRENPGFDVLIGNPPWEKVKVDELQWWGLRAPGLRSLGAKDRPKRIAELQTERPDLHSAFVEELAATNSLRELLLRGPFPGLGAGGDLDLSSAFCWRNSQLLRQDGTAGLVLPRGSLSGSALGKWRVDVLRQGSFRDVVFAINTKHWLFDSVHASYTVAFAVFDKGPEHLVRFCGPFHTLETLGSAQQEMIEITTEEFANWSSSFAFPLLGAKRVAEIYRKIRRSPKFSDKNALWDFRPYREFDAANDKRVFSIGSTDTNLGTPILAGASINIWDVDFAEPFARGVTHQIRELLASKFEKGRMDTRSAYHTMTLPNGMLPIDYPRVAFRDIAGRTNRRTAIAALLPPGTSSVNMAPQLVNRTQDPRSEAFLLGVFCSIPFDWQARKVVEMHLTFELLNDLCFPHDYINSSWGKRLIVIAARLAAKDARYAAWAGSLGVDFGSVVDLQETEELVAELDGLVALMFDLSESDLAYIFDTFHPGIDYEARKHAAMASFTKWKDKA